MKFLFYTILGFIFIHCSSFFKEPGRPPKVNGKPISDQYRYVYVQNFSNNSYAPSLHTSLTQFVKNEIDRRGRFIQTRDKSKAAYRIYGRIEHYQKVGNILDLGDQEISSEIFVIVRLEIQEAGGGTLVLERDEIPGRAYFSNQIGYRESEEQAQARMLANLAIRIAEESENAWYYHVKHKYYTK
ncbi:MAG: hypothetical protein H7A23_00940 [Leptospiraceae bacterium]|nr:hypothetical protein [Leptospiraceae bacterium]